MKLFINGESEDLALNAAFISDVISHYRLSSDEVVVELNGAIVSGDSLDITAIEEGDAIEIVRFMGGGRC